MRNDMNRLGSIIGLLLAGLLCTAPAASKRYAIPQVRIDAALQSDGSMVVAESRTYDFHGSFRYAYRTIPVLADESYEDFSLLENGRPYDLSDSEQPYTFRISRKDKTLEIRWFYQAKNQLRTFELRYRVRNLVQRYQDAAVLYFKFIGRDWDVVNNDVEVRIEPPQPLSYESVQHWAHGPLWARSELQGDGILSVQAQVVPKRTELEVRALYPPAAFPLVMQQPHYVQTQIIRQEREWAEAANRERLQFEAKEEARKARFRWGPSVAALIAGLGLINWWVLYNRNRRRTSAQQTIMRLNSEIPDHTPPALVRYLLNRRTVDGSSLISTLFHLAYRGFVTIKEEQTEQKGIFGGRQVKTDFILNLDRSYWRGHQSELLPYESELLAFLFDQLAAGREQIGMKEMSKQTTAVRKFFLNWQKSVEKIAEEKNYFDKRSLKGMTYALVTAIIGVFVSIGGIIVFGPWLLVATVAMIVLIFLSFLIIRRSDEGERRYHAWKALSRYLKEYQFSKMERNALLSHVNRYFVYGPVLGIGDKHYKMLAEFVPIGQEAHFFPWYIYAASGHGGSPASFATAISSMVGVMSSSAGMGGGASGGGGGGAGGGGGGAG